MSFLRRVICGLALAVATLSCAFAAAQPPPRPSPQDLERMEHAIVACLANRDACAPFSCKFKVVTANRGTTVAEAREGKGLNVTLSVKGEWVRSGSNELYTTSILTNSGDHLDGTPGQVVYLTDGTYLLDISNLMGAGRLVDLTPRHEWARSYDPWFSMTMIGTYPVGFPAGHWHQLIEKSAYDRLALVDTGHGVGGVSIQASSDTASGQKWIEHAWFDSEHGFNAGTYVARYDDDPSLYEVYTDEYVQTPTGAWFPSVVTGIKFVTRGDHRMIGLVCRFEVVEISFREPLMKDFVFRPSRKTQVHDDVTGGPGGVITLVPGQEIAPESLKQLNAQLQTSLALAPVRPTSLRLRKVGRAGGIALAIGVTGMAMTMIVTLWARGRRRTS